MDSTLQTLLYSYIFLQLLTIYFGTRHFYRSTAFPVNTTVFLGFITAFLGGVVFLNYSVSLQLNQFRGSEARAKFYFIALLLSLFPPIFFMIFGLIQLFLGTIRKKRRPHKSKLNSTKN